MASTLFDIFASLQACLFCFPSTPQLRIAGRSYRMLRLLGEGGFSYVYLVQDIADPSRLYALKKIRCPFGQESVSQALKEVEAYSLFHGTEGGQYIIEAVGHEVRDDGGKSAVSGIGTADGEGRNAGNKTVYILLPYYRRGNLQDAINANLVNHTRFPEKRLMEIMLGVCKGLKSMHQYRAGASSTQSQAKSIRQEAADADADAARQAGRPGATGGPGGPKPKRQMTATQNKTADDEEEQEQPFLDTARSEVTAALRGTTPGSVRAYAHRDLKPANIMLADSPAHPIIMDLGSLAPSPTPITSRSIALAVQDTAAEHSTMPYRAPELFDVKTGSVVDTKVDVWSLGCTIYACLIGKSPFEARSEETGGSLSICVLGGDWRWPDEKVGGGSNTSSAADKGKGKAQANGDATGSASASASAGASTNAEKQYPSTGVRDIVRRCLMVEPGERPDVDELQSMIEVVLSSLPEDEDVHDV